VVLEATLEVQGLTEQLILAVELAVLVTITSLRKLVVAEYVSLDTKVVLL
jgi:hypothetical protein